MLTNSFRKAAPSRLRLGAGFSFDGVAQNSYDRFRKSYVDNVAKLHAAT